MRDLALPAPGTEEPEAKPSDKKVRLGDKPVLPPPRQDLTKESVENAAKQAAAAAAAAELPVITEAPPPDLRVERGPPPKPQEMKPEKSKTKSASVKVKKTQKGKSRHQPMAFDDSEVAVVRRDPRRSRDE